MKNIFKISNIQIRLNLTDLNTLWDFIYNDPTMFNQLKIEEHPNDTEETKKINNLFSKILSCIQIQ